MTKKYLISCNKRIAYCPATGKFFREESNGWKEIGLARNSAGYCILTINHKSVTGQRAAMEIMGVDATGYVVDHINRIRDDNRFNNLRLLTVKQNALNTGSVSVTLTKYGTYRAKCGSVSLGCFKDATIARGACLWYRRGELLNVY